MKKESITAKKSTHNSKKLKDRNNENSLIKTNSDNENLLIATEPPQITINMVGGEKWTTNEHYPQRKRVHKITERVKRKDDLSITYRRGKILYYKAHPKAKPEILAVNGLAIWNYNEFFADIDMEGIPHRIFYNPMSKKFLANEIVSYDYDGKGSVLLKNPINTIVSSQITKLLDGIPQNEWLDTLKDVRNKSIKKKQQNKSKSPLKKKGRKPEVKLIRATLYCIKTYNPSKEKKYRPYIEKASEWHKVEGQTMETFISRVYNKWAKVRRDFGRLNKEIRNTKTLYQYAKEALIIPRNTSKQTV